MKGALSGEFEAQSTRDRETPLIKPPVSVTCPKSGSSCQGRRGARKQSVPDGSQSFQLVPVLTPATGPRREVIQDALRLLATWAVRAARARTPGSDSP